jgi:hypothetical protein
MKTMDTLIKNVKQYCILLLLLFAAVMQTKAQAKTMDSATVAAAVQMINIALATDAYNNQQFDMVVISTNGTDADTTAGNCTIQGDNYKCVFDSVEQIQNSFMNLEIHSDGKIFVVSRPEAFTKQFFKSNVDEAFFQQMNINTVSVSMVGTSKKLTFNFLPESEYNTYTITYNPTSYRVSNIFIQEKVADAIGNYSPTNFITTNITLQNFITVAAGSVSFDTNPYVFIGAGNLIQKQAAYPDYQVIDLLKEN